MMIAASVLTVRATATRITAAIVAPTCGIRSSSPVITASTSGNGMSSSTAVTPATIAAMTEIARLPISEVDTARIAVSTVACQRCSTVGVVNPNNQSVIVGRSINRKSARNVSVTSDSTEPNTPPAIPSSVLAASGSPAARSFSASRIVSSALAELTMSWNAGLEVSSSHIAGSALMNSTISSQTGPAVTTTSTNTVTNSRAKHTSEAMPRFQPRRTSLATTGSSPKATIAASRIDNSVPSESTANTTRTPTPSKDRTVRAETVTSTRGDSGVMWARR